MNVINDNLFISYIIDSGFSFVHSEKIAFIFANLYNFRRNILTVTVDELLKTFKWSMSDRRILYFIDTSTYLNDPCVICCVRLLHGHLYICRAIYS